MFKKMFKCNEIWKLHIFALFDQKIIVLAQQLYNYHKIAAISNPNMTALNQTYSLIQIIQKKTTKFLHFLQTTNCN